VSSAISFKLTDPRNSTQIKAKGRLDYTDNPNDGDTIIFDKVTYEFDNNASITV